MLWYLLWFWEYPVLAKKKVETHCMCIGVHTKIHGKQYDLQTHSFSYSKYLRMVIKLMSYLSKLVKFKWPYKLYHTYSPYCRVNVITFNWKVQLDIRRKDLTSITELNDSLDPILLVNYAFLLLDVCCFVQIRKKVEKMWNK